jgi:hypothetical protein
VEIADLLAVPTPTCKGLFAACRAEANWRMYQPGDGSAKVPQTTAAKYSEQGYASDKRASLVHHL